MTVANYRLKNQQDLSFSNAGKKIREAVNNRSLGRSQQKSEKVWRVNYGAPRTKSGFNRAGTKRYKRRIENIPVVFRYQPNHIGTAHIVRETYKTSPAITSKLLMTAQLLELKDQSALAKIEVYPDFWVNVKLPLDKIKSAGVNINSEFIWNSKESRVHGLAATNHEKSYDPESTGYNPNAAEIMEISRQLEDEFEKDIKNLTIRYAED